MAKTEVRGGQILNQSVGLTDDVTGVLPRANGGTGLSAAGANGNVLTSNGTDWVSQAPSGGGSSPLTTKGDIFVRDASASARLPAASDGAILVADSGQTLGVGYEDISFQERRAAQVSKNPGATTLAFFGMAAAPTVTSGIAATNADGANGPQLNISSTAVSGNIASIASAFTQQRRDWDTDIAFFVQTPAGATSAYRIWIGLFSASPGASDTPSVHIAGFRFVGTGAQGASDWRGITAAGSATQTNVASGVNVAASTAYLLRIVCKNNTVFFYVNGKYVGQSTTNLPTSTQLLGYGIYTTALSASAVVLGFNWLSIMSK